MPTYNTPGVYVEEISKFPPSVAAVETAIPAFIGYTERARFLGKDLLDSAVRISSLLEFEERFGSAPPLDVSSVSLDAVNNVIDSTINSNYHLYDSLRLFFNNGGGDCYIISVGLFQSPASINYADMERGLKNVLVKMDEPTLIVFPDGVSLNKQQLANLYKDALEQCQELKDRFLIADVHMNNPKLDLVDFTNDIEDFRTKIGTKYLSYCASYYPYLQVTLPRVVKYRDIKDKVFKLGSMVNWTSNEYVDPTDTDTLNLIAAINRIVDDKVNHLEPDLGNYIAGKDAARPTVPIRTLEDEYLALEAAFLALANDSSSALGDLRTAFINIMTFIYEIADNFVDAYASDAAPLTPLQYPDFITAIRTLGNEQAAVSTNLVTSPTLDTLIKLDNNGTGLFVSGASPFPIYGGFSLTYTTFTGLMIAGNNDITGFDTAFGITIPATTNPERRTNLISMQPALRRVFYNLYASLVSFYTDAAIEETQKQASLILQLPTIKNVIESLQSKFFILPPSSAIAGIYASVDRTRGVFKAPANISLNAVAGPCATVSVGQQDRLNVNVNAGKSINAIRVFAGKGTMVWGARTMAGNDNEWRYVNVRRFFIFAEESIKKATEPFVFEPNDANTWAKIKSMITNFLTLQWRDGALQGAKPAQAFYVKIGLGETMTALDILEGRLIVEVGMAVVRPAEFIILRFAHKLPEA